MGNLITYKIVDDVNGQLKAAGRIACNFWNRFIQPASSIVIRLGTFTEFGNTIARAYEPSKWRRVVYGRIEFNTNYMEKYSDFDIAGVVVHEIGHTIGFGFGKWYSLIIKETGRFTDKAITELPSLADMHVETHYGIGTTLVHWDEEFHGNELMTGIRDEVMDVLPVTIDIQSLLGNKIIEHLQEETPLLRLLEEAKKVEFIRQKQAKALDLDYFVTTPIWEEKYDFGRYKKPLI
jgi:hypothetical protein